MELVIYPESYQDARPVKREIWRKREETEIRVKCYIKKGRIKLCNAVQQQNYFT